jgi:branched-chain amino acid transport system permease protein
MLVYLIVVLSLYMFTGLSGILSFAHVGFMGVGAYISALLTMSSASRHAQLPDLPDLILGVALPTLPTLPAVLIAAAVVTLLAYILAVPLMRLTGLAAAIGTFALLVIINVVLSEWASVTRGKLTFIVTPLDTTLWTAFAWVVAVILMVYLFQESRFGIRLQASREEEVAAASIGVHVQAERRLAFTLSAGMAAISGALYAHLIGSINPEAFFLDLTLLTLAMLVIGGAKTLGGAVVGTVLISILIEGLRRFQHGFSVGSQELSIPAGSQQVVLSVLLLVTLIVRPQGVMGGNELTLKPRRKSLLSKPTITPLEPATNREDDF